MTPIVPSIDVDLVGILGTDKADPEGLVGVRCGEQVPLPTGGGVWEGLGPFLRKNIFLLFLVNCLVFLSMPSPAIKIVFSACSVGLVYVKDVRLFLGSGEYAVIVMGSVNFLLLKASKQSEALIFEI